MSSIDRTQKTIKQLFVGKCWEYLNQNFGKFTTANKIKIALKLCEKDLPTQLEGAVQVNPMPTVRIGKDNLLPDVGEEIDCPPNSRYPNEIDAHPIGN